MQIYSKTHGRVNPKMLKVNILNIKIMELKTGKKCFFKATT